MNTQGKEDECFFHESFSTFINFGNIFRTFVTNKYLRINNWNQKSDPILKSRDGNVNDIPEKSKKEEITEKFNELIQLLNDEGISSNMERSLPTSSNNPYESTPLISI